MLSGDRTVCLWYSGGSDSRLLLEVMIETGEPFGILRFEDGWSSGEKRYVDKTIVSKRLQAMSYPALRHSLVGEGSEVSLVSAYSIDLYGRPHLIVRDLVHDERRCAIDLMLPNPKMQAAPTEFDIHVVGTRSDDRHWILGDHPLGSAEWQNGAKQFIAPLWDWSREDILIGLESFGVELEPIDTGNIECCFNCLKDSRAYCPKVKEEISGVDWDPAKNLENVRQVLCSEKA